MYEKFFGLSRDPFSIAPDPRYLFMSERHREALAHLLYGLDAGGGFVLLTGDIGTGKTTVCRCFLEQIPPNCNVGYIFNPKLTVEELLISICDEFHVGHHPQTSSAVTSKSLIDSLNAFLLNAHAAGQNNVLIIDEAQNLSSHVLEQLRLLTNLETNERKLLQIILIGQPELRGMLARPELEQLAQRVIARFHLDALSQPETTDYIAHRLAIAGLAGPLPFDKSALARAYTLSRGIPRRINLLCGRALLGAYAGGHSEIKKPLIEKAAIEVFGSPSGGPNRQRPSGKPLARKFIPLLLASAVGLAVGAALVGGGANSWPQAAWPSFFSTSESGSKTLAAANSPGVAPALEATIAKTSGVAVASGEQTTVSTSSAPLAAPPPAAPRQLAADQFTAALASSTATEDQTWAALGQLWGLNLATSNDNTACEAAATQNVQCYVKDPFSLYLIRLVDRPGILKLSSTGRVPVYAVLLGLTPQTATLKIDNATVSIGLPLLAQVWDGSFATLWRVPLNMPNTASSGVKESSFARSVWLGNQLGQLSGNAQPLTLASADQRAALETIVRSRVTAFQAAQGLPADSKVGPLTLMQLNRALGLPEPRLQNNKP